MISLAEFSSNARAALKLWTENYHYCVPDLDDCFDPYAWAGIAFLLRATPDLPEYFPKGKWATIQILETMLNEWANFQINECNKETK